MSCCDKKVPIDYIYKPLHKRLVEFGKEIYSDTLMTKYANTFMWVFSFHSDVDMCDECKFQFAEMNNWFTAYGLFENVSRNVKWIIEDEPEKNLIYQDLGFSRTPIHIFADKDGKIIDIVRGFPTPEWLQKHILPLIQEDMNTYA